MRILQVISAPNYPYPLPHLDIIPQGAAYIAAILRQKGYEVRGVCINYDISGDPPRKVLRSYIMKNVREFQPEIILMGGNAPEFLFIRDAIIILRKLVPNVPLILGGRIVTNDIETMQMLKPDIGVIGEGEYTIIDLLQRLKDGNSYFDCPGIAFWRNAKMEITQGREQIENLDVLPFPDYDIFELSTYLEMQNQSDNFWYVRTQKNPRLIPLSAGRSCPYKCTFCQYSLTNGIKMKYRKRSVDNIVEEIVFMKEKYNFNILLIYDDLFSVNKEFVNSFCQKIKDNHLDIHWSASMRVNDVDEKLLKTMKDAGCVHIGYGFESANKQVLKSMNKGISREQILNAISITERAGIGVQGNLIYGDPAETPETVAETEKMFNESCRNFIIHNDYVMPYPGSPIFDLCIEKKIIKEKKDYYESIHLRPRYNMTKMSEKEFYHSIEPIVQNHLVGFKKAKQPRFSIIPRTGFEHAYFNKKILLHVNSICPHCGADNENIFPVNDADQSGPEWKNIIFKPIRFFCAVCHRRMLISTLSVLGLEQAMEKYLSDVNDLAETKTPVILSPYAGHKTIEFCKAYGMNYEGLNIHSYLHPGEIQWGVEFKQVPINLLHVQTVRRYISHDFILLPTIISQKIRQFLISMNIPLERIHYLEGF